jgi:AraC family transcriptional regulator
MNPVAKALWFIESHLVDDVTLAGIVEIAGVSRFHMARAFGMTTGHSVMRYVRGRRLTHAARTWPTARPIPGGSARRRLRLPRSLHQGISGSLRFGS